MRIEYIFSRCWIVGGIKYRIIFISFMIYIVKFSIFVETIGSVYNSWIIVGFGVDRV